MKLAVVLLLATACVVSCTPSEQDLSATLLSGQQWRYNAKDFRAWMGTSSLGNTAQSFAELRRSFVSKLSSWLGSVLGVSPTNLAVPDANTYPYFGWIPPYVDRILPGGPAVTWSNQCFQENSAQLVQSGTGYNVVITVGKPTGLLCSDMYMLATVESLSIQNLWLSGTTTVAWNVTGASDAEMWDLTTKGVRIYKFRDSLISTLGDLLYTVGLFVSEATAGVPDWVASLNIDFMTKYAGFSTKERTTVSVEIDPATINSGDFFGVLRLDGLDPMLAWAMGSTTGHTTVALRDPNGDLYVVESTVKDSYWPTDGIQKTPYAQWITQARAAGYQVVHAPLNPTKAAQFNETAAWAAFKSLEGFEYGYRAMLYGWVDTLKDNYPCLPPDYTQCLQWEHVEILYGLVDKVVPPVGDLLFDQAMNLRLGTHGLRADQVLYTAGQRGIDPRTMPMMVEQDSFVYDTTRFGNATKGPAMVCCVLVCSIWKAGGLFNDIDNDFNCAEQTNWDDYTLNILTVPQRPAQCVAADPTNQLCQLEGKYALNLNNYAESKSYPHMREHCPSEAPYYKKPDGC